MPQAVKCPHCARTLKAPDQLAGKRVACPACRGTVDVPPFAAAGVSAPGGEANRSSAVTRPANRDTEAPDLLVATCPKCAKKLKAPRAFAGKRVKCPACQEVVALSAVDHGAHQATTARAAGQRPSDDEIFGVLGSGASVGLTSGPLRNQSPPMASANPRPVARPQAGASKSPASAPKPQQAKAGKSPVRPAVPARAGRRPRFLYLLFALALLPLGLKSFTADAVDEADIEQRIERTIAAEPDLMAQLEAATSDDEFFALLSDGRIRGAHLAHETWVHWLYAFAAAAVFLFVIRGLFEPGKSTIVQLLLAMACTATVGIISLIIFQWLAEASQGVWISGRGIAVIIFYIVKFIGFSYHAALDPENGFVLSLLGFTFGVGLCEEMTKLIPAVALLKEDKKIDWRAPCALGLASGVGFGLAEGIMYSSNYYNGVSYGDIYLIRFISCVALHAVWAAAATIVAAQRMGGSFEGDGEDMLTASLFAIAVPALLHGLYDTLLNRDMPGFALLTAAASFVWLVVVIERARSFDEPERASFAPALA